MSTFALLGVVEEIHDDRYLVDEVGRRYIIPAESGADFNVGDRVVAEIVIPISASLSWEGRVVRLLPDCNPDEFLDSALSPPPHPEVRAVWESALESDREIGLTDVYRATVEYRSPTSVTASYGFECRSRSAAELVIGKFNKVDGKSPSSAHGETAKRFSE